MALLIVPQAGQLRLIWAQGGVLFALNVLGVVNAGSVAITQALTNTIGTAIKSALTSSGHGVRIGSAITLANIGLRDVRTGNTPEFIDAGAAVAGTGSTDLLPPQTALVITLRTAQAGKQFRGRVYLPGYCEASNAVGGNSSATSEGVAFVTAIQAALVASGLNLGVIHRPTAAPLPVTAGFITPVTAIVCRDAVWDTQRRRAIPGI